MPPFTKSNLCGISFLERDISMCKLFPLRQICRGCFHSSLEKVFMYNINQKKVKPSVPSHVQIIPIKELKEVLLISLEL